MLTELVVRLEHRPGALAALGELLGRNDVDIVALAVVAVPGQEALAHMVVEPADVAGKVLGEAGAQLATAASWPTPASTWRRSTSPARRTAPSSW